MSKPRSNDEELWSAVQGRDASRDGEFFYGVMTTGVYCRPSCNSRRPLRKNVRFFTTPEEAERAGLRPCKRCRPAGCTRANCVESSGARTGPADRCRARQQVQPGTARETLRLQPVPSAAQLQSHHAGSSPKEYQTAARVRMLKKELRNETPVADAIYQAGFGSGSRVYEKADGQLGMTPE